MLVRCPCGSSFWAEAPLSDCPGCNEPVLVRRPGESEAVFADRVVAYSKTVAEIHALPETPPTTDRGPFRRRIPRLWRRLLRAA
jgi:hypothetical protein